MAKLNSKQRNILEKFLQMGSGYVLDFSDRTFAEFFNDEMNINIDNEKYYINGTSKAKRIRAFWDIEPSSIVSELILKLIDYYKYKIILRGKSVSQAEQNLISEVEKIANNINNSQIYDQDENIFLDKDFSNIKIEELPINQSLKDIIEQRLKEINICITNGACLASIFLIGSTMEGVLLGLAEENIELFNKASCAPKDKNQKVLKLQEWKLSQLIDVSYEAGFLREDVKKFSSSLREFRNYMHPKQQQKENFNPDKRTAAICKHVLLATIENLQTAKQKTQNTEKIKITRSAKNIPDYLLRANDGKELLNIISSAHSYSSNYDEVKKREDLEFVARFLQEVQDGVDMSTPFDSISEKINSEIYLTDLIKELEEKGFWLFAGIEKQKISGGVKPVEDDWNMAILYIVSKDSSTIRMADITNQSQLF